MNDTSYFSASHFIALFKTKIFSRRQNNKLIVVRIMYVRFITKCQVQMISYIE